MMYPTHMTYKTLLMAAALTGMAHVALAADGGETVTMADGSEQLAKAASQAKTCEEVVQELNDLLKRGLDNQAKQKKNERDRICEQVYTSKDELPPETKKAEAESTTAVEMTQAQKDAYKQYADSMTKYEMKNLAGRPGLEHIPTKVAPGFAYPDDAKVAGYGMSGSTDGDFGPRNKPCNGCSTFHKGQDYSLRDSTGTMDRNKEIAASAQGTVTFAGQKSGYGNVVEVDHGRYKTLYAHLDSIDVKTGDKVAYGQVVGIGGSTGVGTAAHLHYGVNDETTTANGGWVDPTRFQVTNLGQNASNYTTQEGGANSNPFQIITNNSGNYGNTNTNTGSGTGTGSGSGSGFLSSNNTGLGATISNMLGGNGTGNASGSGNPLSQMLSQLFGGGSSGGSSSEAAGSSGTGSSSGGSTSSGNAVADLIVKTVTEVAANGDTTRTTTYADGRTDTLTIKSTGSTDTQLSTLLVAMLGEDKAASALASIQALCGTNLSTSADADMLKVSKCQQGSSV